MATGATTTWGISFEEGIERWGYEKGNRDQAVSVDAALTRLKNQAAKFWSRGDFPTGANLDNYREISDAGFWTISDAGLGNSLTGTFPEGETKFLPGQFFVLPSGGTSRLVTHIYMPYAPADYSQAVWTRTTKNFGAEGGASFTTWQNLAASGGAVASGGAGHTVQRALMRKRKMGTIPLGGRGAVALRLDHDANGFESIVLPLLQKYSLPASWCQFVDVFQRDATSTNSSWPKIEQIALQNGVEIANHGWTHTDGDYQKELADSRYELQRLMPDIVTDTFMIPGVLGTKFGGWPYGKPEEWHKYPAAQTVLENHGYSTGATSQWHPLTGDLTPGAAHFGIEQLTSSTAINGYINRAATYGVGIILMAHPQHFGKTGYTSVAVLEEILAHIAAQRDAGLIEVLTVGGLSFADTASTNPRPTLYPRARGGWFGGTGTFSTNVGTAKNWEYAGSAGSALTGGAAWNVYDEVGGGIYELRATVTAGSSGAIVRVKPQVGPSGDYAGLVSTVRTVSIPAGTTQTVRQAFTYPNRKNLFYVPRIEVASGTATITTPETVAI